MRRAVLLVSCVGLVAAAAAQADTQPVLRIVFPEGLTARQMADQSAHVRRIAIAKRGVTPRLSGASYAAATAAAHPPAAFRPFLKRRSVEGFLFPALYEFGPSTPAASFVALQPEPLPGCWSTSTCGRPKPAAERRTTCPRLPRWSRRRRSRRRSAPSSPPSSTTGPRAGCRSRSTPRSATASGSRGRGRSRACISRATRRTTHTASRGCRRPRSRTPASPRSRPRRGRRGSTTSTTSASRTASIISSRPTSRSSAGRPSSTATAAATEQRPAFSDVGQRLLRGGAELREDVGHLEPRPHGLGARLEPVVGLVRLLEREHAEGDRDAGLGWRPEAASPATKSKCGVSPRITQPSATSAGVPARLRERHRGDRELERPRDGHDRDRVPRHPAASSSASAPRAASR